MPSPRIAPNALGTDMKNSYLLSTGSQVTVLLEEHHALPDRKRKSCGQYVRHGETMIGFFRLGDAICFFVNELADDHASFLLRNTRESDTRTFRIEHNRKIVFEIS